MTLGITLSKWSGTVGFTTMVKADVSFVSIRSTIGDEGFDENYFDYWEDASRVGLLRRPFHLVNADDPFAQADNFLGSTFVGDLPPALDYEDPDIPEDVISTLAYKVWYETGWPPDIYTRANIWDQLDDTQWSRHFGLWVAHYGVNEPTIPAPWPVWDYWQKTDSEPGDPYGVFGNTAIIDEFNGSLDELLHLSQRYRKMFLLRKRHPDIWHHFFASLIKVPISRTAI